MKKLILYLQFVFLASSFYACSDEVYSSRLKELILEDMTFNSAKSTQALTFRHEDMSNYECMSSEDWCVAAFDVNNSKMIVSVQANQTYDPRSATITLADKIDGTMRAFTVNQERNTGLFIGETLFEVSMYGGSATVELESNVSYDVVIPSDCDWVTMNEEASTRGLEKSSFTLNVSENKTYKERKAYITVTNKDENLSGTVTIIQPFETVFNADTTSFILDMDGGIIKVNMKTNIDYDIEIPEESNWIKVYEPSKTRQVKASTVMFKVDENKSYAARDGVVYLCNNEAGKEIRVFVHQTFTPVLNSDNMTFDVNMEGGTVTVNMESNISYDVSIPEDCDWVTRAKTNKTKAVTTSSVTLNVAENKSYQERNVTVTISNMLAGVSVPITIHQLFITVFKADKTDFDVDMLGGSITVNMESNISYEMSIPSDCDWIILPTNTRKNGATRATSTSALTFKVKENTSYKDRDAIITITNKEAEEKGACKPIKITVHQPFNTVFKADKTDFDVDMSGGNVTVNLESNISYEVFIPSDCDWITLPTSSRKGGATRATNTSNLTFKVKENATYKNREAIITITNKEAEEKGSCKPIKIAVHQPFNTVFKADKTDFDVDMDGGSITINMESNITYDVSIPSDCDWIYLPASVRNTNATRATTTSSVVLRVKKNSSYKDRVAVVTIGNKEAGKEIKISVHQPFNTVFKADKTDFDVDMSGGSVTVNMESNITYDVETGCDWVTLQTNSRNAGATRATSTSALVFRVKENTSYKARDAVITIINKEANRSIKIYIHQSFNTTFKVDKTDFEVSQDGGSVTINVESNITFDVNIPSDCDWITKASSSRTRAANTYAIVLHVKKNTSYKSRKAVITIGNKEAGEEENVSISQPFDVVFKADKTDFDVDMSGGSVTVNMESNITYDVETGCDWVTLQTNSRNAGATRATSTSALVFRVKENTSYNARDAIVTISNKEANRSIKIYIHQSFNTTFKVDKTDFEVSQDGGSVTINLESNITFDVNVPSDCDWITKASSSRTRAANTYAIVLHVKENTTYKNRETSITITNKEAEKKGACKPIKIAIRQPFNTVFKADKTDFDVAMSGGSVTVNMESNIKYDVDTGCDWVTFQKNTRTNGVTRATSTSAVVLRVKENNNYDARDAVVTISNKEAQKEGAIDGPIKIYIHQQPFVATLKVDKSELEVGTDGGAVSVNVESNVDFNVIMPSGCDWISQGNSARRTRASKTSVVTFNVSKNTSGQERSATIIISNTTAKVSSSVKITQKFSSTFNVNETPLEIDELGGNLGIHVAANVDVSVETDKSWLSVGGKTNVGNGYWTQQITVQPLKTKVAQRKGKVTFLYNQTGQSFNVEITQNRLLYITESEITLTAKDESKPLTLNNPENMEVKWSSSDTKVAKVSSQGKVTAVGNGTAEITVKSSDGKYSDKVKVTVEIEEGE